MLQTILLIFGMVLGTAFARRNLRSGSAVSRDKLDAGRHSPEKVKMAADNLKAAWGNEQRHKKKLGAERLRVVVVSKWEAR
jgi:hypothetical protein